FSRKHESGIVGDLRKFGSNPAGPVAGRVCEYNSTSRGRPISDISDFRERNGSACSTNSYGLQSCLRELLGWLSVRLPAAVTATVMQPQGRGGTGDRYFTSVRPVCARVRCGGGRCRLLTP